MQLYTIISVVVVILTTSALYIILRRNHVSDYRYHIGLGISAVTAVTVSLFLPGLMIAFTKDLLLKLAVSFFIALLAYITLLFLVMMLVMSIFTKKKMESLQKKWSEKRLARKNAKEQKQKLKEEAAAEADQKDKTVQEPGDKPSESEDKDKKLFFRSLFTKKSSEQEMKLESEKTQVSPGSEEAVKPVSENEADTKQDDAPEQEEISASSEKPSEPEKTEKPVSENEADNKQTELPGQEGIPVSIEESSDTDKAENQASENEAGTKVSYISVQDEIPAETEELPEPDQPELASVKFEQADDLNNDEEIPELVWQEEAVVLPKTEIPAEIFYEPEPDEEAAYSYDQPENLTGNKEDIEESLADFTVPDESAATEAESQDSLAWETGQPYGRSGSNDEKDAGFLSEYEVENEQKTEKNVDTSIIIDKMGSDENAEQVIPGSDNSETDLNGLIDGAFRLKQEGREIEAVSLYMEALSKKPDSETVFHIVLDICVIYKNAGLTELAEDILQCYIDEFENVMSAEVKEQILQNLYS